MTNPQLLPAAIPMIILGGYICVAIFYTARDIKEIISKKRRAKAYAHPMAPWNSCKCGWYYANGAQYSTRCDECDKKNGFTDDDIEEYELRRMLMQYSGEI